MAAIQIHDLTFDNYEAWTARLLADVPHTLAQRRRIHDILFRVVQRAGLDEPTDVREANVAPLVPGRDTLQVQITEAAPSKYRQSPGRFRIAASWQLFIGSRGGLSTIDNSGKHVTGRAAFNAAHRSLY